ncbi:poxvirus late transcription factor VLTF3 like-domain-containing protein [Blyttiomyces helicus]|uniref:Poxvirus late transcription factor VLTF3 like-domain-containing protein n=1 Tax=Blyttiomyces helicus TaxID=388810 RepID=A0A4P9WQ40_9FUNG|nr:poxvirus late transcription factor VLTF3 like-domain-containing protein [Blyttiomyces helicus]|eukprot:RKO94273.1 poxvirus late transcription factor VLTF3 like-domain-containing protein [Blyttiomyces helicus]
MSNKIAVHGNKPKKTKSSPSHGSDVLWMHDTKMKYFEHLQNQVLPEKCKKLEKLIARGSGLNDSLKKGLNKKEISVLEAEIHLLESREEEVDYLSKTHLTVNKYVEMLENQDESMLKRDTTGSITKYIGKYDNIEKEKIAEEYCQILNNGLMINTNKLKFNNSTCSNCKADTYTNQGFVSCVSCGLASENPVHDYRVSYNDFQDTTYKSPFSYKRINRFLEILTTLQAKENTDIPEFVMNAVQKEISKEQRSDLENINTDRTKHYLKRLSLTNFYEHAPRILMRVNGVTAVQIPTEVEEKLKEMFKSIQDPFVIVKEKFCELLDLKEYQNCFTLLKSFEKLRLQDKIWKGICEILDWEYISSI